MAISVPGPLPQPSPSGWRSWRVRQPHAPKRPSRLKCPALALVTMPWKYPPAVVRKCPGSLVETMAMAISRLFPAHGETGLAPERFRDVEIGAQKRRRLDHLGPARIRPAQVGFQPGRQCHQLTRRQFPMLSTPSTISPRAVRPAEAPERWRGYPAAGSPIPHPRNRIGRRPRAAKVSEAYRTSHTVQGLFGSMTQ